MQLQLIRNATIRLSYASQQLLIDPFLAAKHSRPSFTGRSPNPMVDLPCAPEDVIAGADLTLISHLHADHFDPLAQELLPKTMPIICQPGDEERIQALGFSDVTPLTTPTTWRGITLTPTPCRHGSGAVLSAMGSAIGFLLQAEGEPTIYWAGDTILTADILALVQQSQPDIIITHSCGAVWGEERTLIMMDAAQTVELCLIAPQSIVIATHMEALDHATVSRDELRRHAEDNGIRADHLRIPADGEELTLEA